MTTEITTRPTTACLRTARDLLQRNGWVPRAVFFADRHELTLGQAVLLGCRVRPGEYLEEVRQAAVAALCAVLGLADEAALAKWSRRQGRTAAEVDAALKAAAEVAGGGEERE